MWYNAFRACLVFDTASESSPEALGAILFFRHRLYRLWAITHLEIVPVKIVGICSLNSEPA